MGQKVSTNEDSCSITSSKKGSQEFKTKYVKSSSLADVKKTRNENDDFKPTNRVMQNLTDEQEKSSDVDIRISDYKERSRGGGNSTRKNANDDNNDNDDDDEKIDRTIVNDSLETNSLLFTINPSIAELSQFTALKMMGNLEELTGINNLLQNQVMDETMNDNLSEKDVCTISYEDFPTVQIQENERKISQDSLNSTEEMKNPTSDNSESSDYTQDKLSCKNTKQEAISRSRINRMFDGDSSDDITKMKEILKNVKYERDEARLNLKLANDRCRMFEEELKSTELALDYMADKLRAITTELKIQVQNSRDLEYQLSKALRNSKNVTSP